MVHIKRLREVRLDTNTRILPRLSHLWKTLEVINFDGNMFDSIDASAFDGLKNLRILSLNELGLGVVAQNSFEGLESLEILRLNGHRLKNIKMLDTRVRNDSGFCVS